MNILVTGGAGFVGTNLVKKLLTHKHNVTVIDDFSTGLLENKQPGCKYYNQDIITIDDYSAYGNYDIVFHLAAIARIQPSFEDPQRYFRTNAVGTFKLAQWASRYNIPMVYAGSSSKHSGKFKNPYTFSKDIGEDIINLFKTHYNLKATIARFYNVYGPHQLLTGGYTTLIGRWISNIENNKECFIYGDGEQRRDFTHVDDIVDALMLIMEKNAYGYEFELGRGQNYSVNEVAAIFNIKPTYTVAQLGEARHTLNTSKLAQEILGWNPQRDLKDYINSLWKK